MSNERLFSKMIDTIVVLHALDGISIGAIFMGIVFSDRFAYIAV